MDPNSGKIYRDIDEKEAKKRGLVAVSEQVANMVEIGAMAMSAAEKRRDTAPKKTKTQRKKKNDMAKASRRANR